MIENGKRKLHKIFVPQDFGDGEEEKKRQRFQKI